MRSADLETDVALPSFINRERKPEKWSNQPVENRAGTPDTQPSEKTGLC